MSLSLCHKTHKIGRASHSCLRFPSFLLHSRHSARHFTETWTRRFNTLEVHCRAVDEARKFTTTHLTTTAPLSEACRLQARSQTWRRGPKPEQSEATPSLHTSAKRFNAPSPSHPPPCLSHLPLAIQSSPVLQHPVVKQLLAIQQTSLDPRLPAVQLHHPPLLSVHCFLSVRSLPRLPYLFVPPLQILAQLPSPSATASTQTHHSISKPCTKP